MPTVGSWTPAPFSGRFERLEPGAGKLARPVLREGGAAMRHPYPPKQEVNRLQTRLA